MKRLYTLDMIRGLSVIAMIIFHTLWDMIAFFGVSMPIYAANIQKGFGMAIGITFILVSGFSFGLGKRHFVRAVQVLCGGLCICAVTLVIMPRAPIIFGVLSLIGSMMLIMIPLRRILEHINPYALFIICIFVFSCLTNLKVGRVGIGSLSFNVPKVLYSNIFTTYLGFPEKGFSSADYYPLLPWMPLYIAGYALFLIFKRKNAFEILSKGIRIKPLEWVGRHSLIIYLVHQPIIYAVLYIIFLIIYRN